MSVMTNLYNPISFTRRHSLSKRIQQRKQPVPVFWLRTDMFVSPHSVEAASPEPCSARWAWLDLIYGDFLRPGVKMASDAER